MNKTYRDYADDAQHVANKLRDEGRNDEAEAIQKMLGVALRARERLLDYGRAAKTMSNAHADAAWFAE